MADITITLPDSMKAFVETKVGPGRLQNVSSYVQLLISEAMDAEEFEFTKSQRERIDQLLLESTDSFERGNYAPLRPGEFEEVVKRVIEQQQGKQAS